MPRVVVAITHFIVAGVDGVHEARTKRTVVVFGPTATTVLEAVIFSIAVAHAQAITHFTVARLDGVDKAILATFDFLWPTATMIASWLPVVDAVEQGFYEASTEETTEVAV